MNRPVLTGGRRGRGAGVEAAWFAVLLGFGGVLVGAGLGLVLVWLVGRVA